MILTCPSCGTQYVVKDGAIPPEGRQVRCASCKHSWHQDPDGALATEREPQDQAAAAEPEVEQPADDQVGDRQVASEGEDEDESIAEATLIAPRSGPAAEERAYEEATLEGEEDAANDRSYDGSDDRSNPTEARAPVNAEPDSIAAPPPEDWQEPPHAEAQDDEFTPYPAADEVEPRRRGPALAIAIVVIVVIAIAAAFWFLAPPELKAQLGLGAPNTSPLALVTTHMDRQRLASGNELLTVTGRVINPTGKEQDVPPLRAQLKTRAGKIVYSWTIAPPARSLGAGASASFNSAEVNVPPGGDELTITLGAAG